MRLPFSTRIATFNFEWGRRFVSIQNLIERSYSSSGYT